MAGGFFRARPAALDDHVCSDQVKSPSKDSHARVTPSAREDRTIPKTRPRLSTEFIRVTVKSRLLADRLRLQVKARLRWMKDRMCRGTVYQEERASLVAR